MLDAPRSAAAMVIMAIVLAILQSAATAATERTLRFSVSLDGRDIGEHRFVIRDAVASSDEATSAERVRSVTIEADFLVRLLRIPVFRYSHQNHEFWDGGCLYRLESETVTNGSAQQVELARGGSGYLISAADREQRLDAPCLLSFAYWDPAIIGAEQLVNAQNGALVDVEITALGRQRPDWLDAAETDTPVQAFRIQADDDGDGSAIDIRVYYSDDWDWVGLESPVTGGRLMRYHRIDTAASD